MKIVKRVGIIVISILVVGIIAFFGIGNYFYNFALNRETSKELVMEGNQDTTNEEDKISDETVKEENEKWLKDKAEEKYITSKDSLKLHAYEVKNEKDTHKWMVVVHGYASEGKNMVGYMRKFYDMGYHVLAMDLRGHGLSEGDYIGMGWPDRLDVIQWIEAIVKQDSQSEIMLFGISMGAATVMMTTGEELPSNVKLAIEDCGYSSIWDEFAGQLEKLFHLPTFPALDAANIVTQIRAKYSFKEGSSVEQVKKSKTPTLFIHGSKDDFVPFEMLEQVYEAANCKKEKLVIDGAGHAEAADVNPELYWNTIKNFIQENE